ncbi:hypothetical protein L1887_18799 [Cichorium endivia]|nr:hypothetical protein L1887_18799 [Cichorium endivia]
MATSLVRISGLFSSTTANTTRPTTIHSYFKTSKFQPHKPISIYCHRPNYIPNNIQDPNRIRIFDTTLRDGEQAPGASMTPKQKLDIAHQLAKLGADIIEVGFPASNKADLDTVKLIAREVGNIAVNDVDDGHIPVICGLARCHKNDVDKAWEAVKYAKFPRIHIFIATSEIHMKYKLKMSKEEVIEKARSMVEYSRSLGCNDVQFSPEDAGRSDREFLYEVLGEAVKAGATTLCIPDTVGYNWPREFGQLIADIKANTPGAENVIISTHCHNDLGLATANTLEGAYSGARQLEVTVNGIGERAGNASLEEVVMTIKSKGELLGGLYTDINTKHIVMASKMVEEYSGMQVQPHKPIVGANAFAHESGIHQDGVLKNKITYEIISPEDIGLHRSNASRLTLGKLSGRHALKVRLFEVITDDDLIMFSFLPGVCQNAAAHSLHPNVQKDSFEHHVNTQGFEIPIERFPTSSEADLQAVKLIAQEIGNVGAEEGGHIPVIFGLERCNKNDIDKSWEAMKHTKFPRIHTFIATSEIQMTKEQVIEKARSIVAYARSLGVMTLNLAPKMLDYTILMNLDSLLENSGIGRHVLKSKLFELGYAIDGKGLTDLFWRFKSVAEIKKVITDDDLVALVSDEVFQPQVVWKFGDVQVTCGTLGLSTATVKLNKK